MKNEMNLRRYRWLSPLYDLGVKNNPLFERPRNREFELAQIQLHHRVLLVGIGTGLDIPYLPEKAEVVGIDISPVMLERAKKRAGNRNVSLYEMKAEQLDFEDGSFDMVVMNCIISVVDDPNRAMQEATRVLKPSGSVWILGKFIESEPSVLRKGLNWITTSIGGANITLSLNELIEGVPLQKTHHEPTLAADIIQLRHTKRSNESAKETKQ